MAEAQDVGQMVETVLADYEKGRDILRTNR